MRKVRFVAAIVLSAFVAGIAAPVFAGGTDVPIILSVVKTKTQIGTFHLNGGSDVPGIPPGGRNKEQSTSYRSSVIERLGSFVQIWSVVWGGGSPHH